MNVLVVWALESLAWGGESCRWDLENKGGRGKESLRDMQLRLPSQLYSIQNAALYDWMVRAVSNELQ